MIQFNLLPDIKLKYIKVRRTKRAVVGVALLAIIVSVIVVAGLASVVEVAQKRHLSGLDTKIDTYAGQLKKTPELNKILTVQNQLKTLPHLHGKKPDVSRLFGYLKKLTPSSDGIADLKVDFDANTMSISGKAKSLDSVNQFADILKNATYQATSSDASHDTQRQAFSKVVLSQFSRDAKGASYTLTCGFESDIFDNSQSVKLRVPSITTTRSTLHSASDLFTKNKPMSQG